MLLLRENAAESGQLGSGVPVCGLLRYAGFCGMRVVAVCGLLRYAGCRPTRRREIEIDKNRKNTVIVKKFLRFIDESVGKTIFCQHGPGFYARLT